MHGQRQCPQPHTEPHLQGMQLYLLQAALAQTQPSVSAAHPGEERERTLPIPPTHTPCKQRALHRKEHRSTLLWEQQTEGHSPAIRAKEMTGK